MENIEQVLQKLKYIDCKCDRIIVLLNQMQAKEGDKLIQRLKDSAEDMYMSSVIERERNGLPILRILKS